MVLFLLFVCLDLRCSRTIISILVYSGVRGLDFDEGRLGPFARAYACVSVLLPDFLISVFCSVPHRKIGLRKGVIGPAGLAGTRAIRTLRNAIQHSAHKKSGGSLPIMYKYSVILSLTNLCSGLHPSVEPDLRPSQEYFMFSSTLKGLWWPIIRPAVECDFRCGEGLPEPSRLADPLFLFTWVTEYVKCVLLFLRYRVILFHGKDRKLLNNVLRSYYFVSSILYFTNKSNSMFALQKRPEGKSPSECSRIKCRLLVWRSVFDEIICLVQGYSSVMEEILHAGLLCTSVVHGTTYTVCVYATVLNDWSLQPKCFLVPLVH